MFYSLPGFRELNDGALVNIKNIIRDVSSITMYITMYNHVPGSAIV